MCEDLKNQLEWINENLNTIAQNQSRLYDLLKQIEKRISPVDKPKD